MLFVYPIGVRMEIGIVGLAYNCDCKSCMNMMLVRINSKTGRLVGEGYAYGSYHKEQLELIEKMTEGKVQIDKLEMH